MIQRISKCCSLLCILGFVLQNSAFSQSIDFFGKRLPGARHNIDSLGSITVVSPLECLLRCRMTDSCRSVNAWIQGDRLQYELLSAAVTDVTALDADADTTFLCKSEVIKTSAATRTYMYVYTANVLGHFK